MRTSFGTSFDVLRCILHKIELLGQAMNHTFARIFIAHPQSVDETYFEHMRFAGWFAARLFLAGGAALIHAVIPCLFEKTASHMISEMHVRLVSRS
jgi:hypothetical protein